MSNIVNRNLEHCTQCPRQCPMNDLRCGRGRKLAEEQGISLGEERSGGREVIEENTFDSEKPELNRHGRKNGQSCYGGRRGCGHDERGHKNHRGGRGFGCGTERKRWENEGENELTALLGRCGHYLYHCPWRGRGQDRILKILAGQENVTQKELQQYLEIQSGSMSEIISKLEVKGYVRRRKDEDDRRKIVLELTEEGALSVKSRGEEKVDLYSALSSEEQEKLKELLKKLLESWHER